MIPPRTFTDEHLLQIGMPMGGIGAGCVCLNGVGGLQDFSIFHKPATTALPDGWEATQSCAAMIHVRGDHSVTRLVEGQVPRGKIYDQGLQGQGFRHSGFEGLPRFKTARFSGQYPFGTVELADPKVPVEVSLEGWSPFIPNDDVNSGIPCAILRYRVRNVSEAPVEFAFSFHLAHPANGGSAERNSRNRALPGFGVELYNVEDPESVAFGSQAIGVIGHDPRIKAMWFRGGWFDSVSALWHQVESDTFSVNDGSLSELGMAGRNGGSLEVSATLAPGESVDIPIVYAWYNPNCDLRIGGVKGSDTGPNWHPFYSTKWTSAADVAQYVAKSYESLRARTSAFRDAIFSSTLPPTVVDAIASNLAILKSPTVMRQANGNFWGWEGCFTKVGSCHGTCTHVWNYAQALPHLFPALERTIREQEYLRSMDERGHVNFRAAIPDGPTPHDFHAASDGQLGGVMKLYRDWQISGDNKWLAEMYPLAKLSLDYCIATWDPDKRGALFEPHHNTYDIEFWGPDGMCTSIYLGALCALAEMGCAVGDSSAESYAALAEKCAAFMDAKLFEGGYYRQHVMWDGLRDTSMAEEMAKPVPAGDEMAALIAAEGPKYQYGSGCISDGVIGAWMANVYGIETPLDKEKVREHLRSLYRFNFKTDLSEHACPQRPGYALGAEPGLLLCTWPNGGKPTLPFVYSDEVWTGIEYQVATHMISEGLVEEGLKLVEAVRSRYDGKVRNPFSEYECGIYYARAMASYALVGTLAGFSYSNVTKTLRVAPKLDIRPFRMFFSVATGFGSLVLTEDGLTIQMIEGELSISRVVLGEGDSARTIEGSWVAKAGETVQVA